MRRRRRSRRRIGGGGGEEGRAVGGTQKSEGSAGGRRRSSRGGGEESRKKQRRTSKNKQAEKEVEDNNEYEIKGEKKQAEKENQVQQRAQTTIILGVTCVLWLLTIETVILPKGLIYCFWRMETSQDRFPGPNGEETGGEKEPGAAADAEDSFIGCDVCSLATCH